MHQTTPPPRTRPPLRGFALLLALLTVGACTGCQALRTTISNIRGNTPGRYARLMEDAKSPDNRRVGISTLVRNDFARRDPYTARYRQIFLSDADPLVRASALRALNVSRDGTASDLYVRALADPEVLVRREGAKALSNMPSPEATDALLKALNAPDEDADVRMAAAAALRHYARRDVARSLVAVLDERTFGVAWQARRSLRRMTHVDHAYDGAAWLEFINDPNQPLG